ncbi:TonB-dependent receptor [Pseudoxanthomonas mexicana]
MTFRPSPLNAALLFAITAPAMAAPTGDAATDAAMQAKELDTVEVHGERVQKASSPKYTEALVDTPQTITVVTSEVMAQQNLLGLRDVLSTLPGITFGAGEGGGGYGDSINLRGFTASSDITTDGVRDSAQYTRTDNFNLDSIELINGANSAMSGAGSVGGTINLVSKVAREGDFSTFTVGAGTDKYGRVTADTNHDLENGIAVRLNAMVHQNDVPGRDHESFQRWGFAPSIVFGLGSDTRVTLSYLHQSDDNLPQYGVPYALNPFNDGALSGVDRESYFGYRNVSEQQIDIDMLTGIFEHDFSDQVSVRSLARLQKVDQLSNVTALQGTWCLDNGTNPYTGAVCSPAGIWNPNSGPRGFVRDTSNFMAISQTDLTARFSTGAIEHALVAGVAFSKEDFDLDTGSVFNNSNGTSVTVFPLVDINNPYNVWTGPLNYYATSRTKGSLNNQAVYLFDTIRFTPQFSLNLGARYERNEGDTVTWTASTVAATRGQYLTAPSPSASNSDNLFSYRAGLVYKPAENGSIYLAYANSETPSKASVNGSCTLNSTTGGNNCSVAPETAVNVELGTKWDLFGTRLALTAAVFRNERQNYRVADPDPLNLTGEQSLDGKARVDGIALGAAGNITREWSLFANYTYLDSEVLHGVSSFCAANPGAANCGNTALFPDPLKGNPLTNTPKHSMSLWSTYQLNDWSFGYGATYQGGFYTQNSSLLGDLDPYKTEAYWVHRAMVGYRVNDSLGLQLNLNNLFDEEYYTRIRNNVTLTNGVITTGSGWATPGEGRSAVLTATLKF